MKKAYLLNILKNNSFDLLNHNYNTEKKHFNNYKPSVLVFYFNNDNKAITIENLIDINYDFYYDIITLYYEDKILKLNNQQVKYKINYSIFKNVYIFYVD